MNFRKSREPVKQEKTKEAADDVLQELGSDDMDQVNGGINPFAGVPRAENQSIDKDLRDNG